jgi:ABC-type nitrate/sulfonate/bicarbonate transport system substrate-binding protein
MIRSKWVAFFLTVFALALVTGPARAEKLIVGWSAVSALNAPFWVMNDAGFLKKEGLDAQLIYVPSSSTMAQAQLSGNVHISTANSQVVVDADLTARRSGGDRRRGKHGRILHHGQSENLQRS